MAGASKNEQLLKTSAAGTSGKHFLKDICCGDRCSVSKTERNIKQCDRSEVWIVISATLALFIIIALRFTS